MTTQAKEMIFDEEAREYLLTGIQKLANAIAFTLGPRGKNVGLEKSWGAPAFSNVGGVVAKEIELQNPFENMGASMAKEVVQKIKEKCGDGTTTGIVLLKAMVEEGIKQVAGGASPIELKRGMEKAVDAVIKEIESKAIKIKADEEIRQIAEASAGGDGEIGTLIADAIKKVGRTGVVTIEEAKGTSTTIEIVEGMQFDRGYISPYFCTNPEKMTVEMEHPKILLLDGKVSNIHEILPVLQAAATSGEQLLIIAEDIEGDALSTLVVNKIRGSLKVCAVKAPGFGDRRKEMLKDLAALTGARVISEETGETLKEFSPDTLGSAEKVTITKESTTMVGGQGDQKEIKGRIQQIENERANSDSSYDKEKLEERKAKLSGGVAVIRVGAATEPELKKRKQAFEDSLSSTKAALEEGIVPGGGVAFLRAATAALSLDLQGDAKNGAKIIATACRMPAKQIAMNSGHDGSLVVSELLASKDANIGFNAITEKYEDMTKAGIIDPVKMVKSSLLHAASVAVIVLISEVLICDAEEEEE